MFLAGSQGALPKHLDHPVELLVGELGDDILEQKLFWHDRADELHKLMRRSRHIVSIAALPFVTALPSLAGSFQNSSMSSNTRFANRFRAPLGRPPSRFPGSNFGISCWPCLRCRRDGCTCVS